MISKFTIAAEIDGWLYFIDKFAEAHTDPSKYRVGLVVDSELAKLEAFNERIEPLLGNRFLPANFELIYASADAGAEEFFINQLMRVCDRRAWREYETLRDRFIK